VSAFEKSFERLMGHEGGYTPGVGDPGGETNWGISKRSYPHLNIKKLTRAAAKEIYRRDFWQRARMDEFDLALAFQVFDFAVNSGIETAVRKLQAAAGVADDGHVGPITVAAIKAKSVADMVMLFAAERLDFWTSLSTWSRFGRTWARRAAQNLRFAAEDTPA
jgi:lysozyme family protein